MLLVRVIAFVLLTTTFILTSMLLALAQTSTAKPGEIPPCPTQTEQARSTGEKRADGTETAPARPVERSIILPSAGEPPADRRSADDVRAGVDCTMRADHPNAIKPGDVQRSFPDQAK